MSTLIAKLRILVKEANYPVKHNDRFLRVFLLLGMNSDHVHKDCFKVGNALMFNAGHLKVFQLILSPIVCVEELHLLHEQPLRRNEGKTTFKLIGALHNTYTGYSI